jgi:hypothetical protein
LIVRARCGKLSINLERELAVSLLQIELGHCLVDERLGTCAAERGLVTRDGRLRRDDNRLGLFSLLLQAQLFQRLGLSGFGFHRWLAFHRSLAFDRRFGLRSWLRLLYRLDRIVPLETGQCL